MKCKLKKIECYGISRLGGVKLRRKFLCRLEYKAELVTFDPALGKLYGFSEWSAWSFVVFDL